MIKTGNIFLTKYFVFVYFLLFSWIAFAGLQVTATVDRTEAGIGDSFTLVVSVQSSEEVDVSEPRVPNLDGFDLVNTWNSSSTSSKLVQGANGMQFDTIRRQDFNYMLSPKKAGKISIPAFEVVVAGKPQFTKPIVMTISTQGSGAAKVPRGRGQVNPGGGAGNFFDDMDDAEEMFNQLLQRRGMNVPNAQQRAPINPNEAFFIQVEVDKNEVFEGEQIVANWYLYTRGNLLSLDRLKFPDLKGFWKEIIEEVPALNFTQEVINGVPYRKALLASHALFPIKSGTAVIDEYKVKASAQLPTGPMGSFGFGQAYTYTRSSERVKIKVNPLPTEGKPGDFSGAVGQFDVNAFVEGEKFPAHQPLSLKVRFEGSGNAKLIELPPLNLPNTVELFDTKSESKFFKNGKSYKEFEVLIVPRQEGSLTIPKFSVSMFDPVTRKYVTKTTEPIQLTISPGQKGAVQDQRMENAKNQVKVEKALALPVLIMKLDQPPIKMPLVTWVVVFLLVAGILVWHARKEFQFGLKQKSLKVELVKRMKRMRALNDKKDWRAVATESTNLIYYILGHISSAGGMNLDKILDSAPPSIRRELGEEIKKMVELFQVMSFAPEAAVGKYKEQKEIDSNLEKVQSVLEKAIVLSEDKEKN